MSIFDKAKNWFVKQTNDLTPAQIPTKSVFLEDGRLLPEEFTSAGNQLIIACQAWSWSAAVKPGVTEPKLDAGKQFLKMTTVSRRRYKEEPASDVQVIELDHDFKAIGADLPKTTEKYEQEEIPEKKEAPVIAPKAKIRFEDEDDEEEIPVTKTPQSANAEAQKNDALADIEKRIYEVHITYDRHYLTPRLWLAGTDYKNQPLKKEQIMEEIVPVYQEKTVTFDKQPHTGQEMVNIHPCKHANVLKTFALTALENGNEVRPDQSLFLFLKFIASVVPTVELDFTVDLQI